MSIRNAARGRFSAFLNTCGAAFPTYIQARYAKKINPIVAIIQVVFFSLGGIVAILCSRKPSHKLYIFQGARFVDIHSLHPPTSVVIIGGVHEWRYARSKGYGFHWDGYIKKLFNVFYFAKSNFAFSVLFLMVRKLLGGKLGGQSRLFLFEDTVQVGLPLALILEDITPVVCIAHGFFAKPNDGYSLVCDGDACSYNLIYEDSQKEFYFKNKNNCIALGLPYEVPFLSGISRDIVLVEQSTVDMPEEYDQCLSYMGALAAILSDCGYKYIYRTRFGAVSRRVAESFERVHVGDKMELLAGARKIFIGFNSTLLYEAGVAGHVTIGLDDEAFAYSRFFNVNYFLSEIKKDVVKSIIEAAYLNLENTFEVRIQPLEVRFGECMRELNERISCNESIHF